MLGPRTNCVGRSGRTIALSQLSRGASRHGVLHQSVEFVLDHVGHEDRDVASINSIRRISCGDDGELRLDRSRCLDVIHSGGTDLFRQVFRVDADPLLIFKSILY